MKKVNGPEDLFAVPGAQFLGTVSQGSHAGGYLFRDSEALKNTLFDTGDARRNFTAAEPSVVASIVYLLGIVAILTVVSLIIWIPR
jgi:hypothetical protein